MNHSCSYSNPPVIIVSLKFGYINEALSVSSVRSAAAARGRRRFRLTRARRSELAEKIKTKVEKMRERREA